MREMQIKPTKQRKTWTKTDYYRAQARARQEYLLKELLTHIMASGLSTYYLATRSGVAPSTIEAWKRGDRKFAIARTLTAVGREMGGTLGWRWN